MSRRQNPLSVVHCPGCYEKLYYDDATDPDTLIEDHTMIECKTPDPIVAARAQTQFDSSPPPASAGKPKKGHETNHA